MTFQILLNKWMIPTRSKTSNGLKNNVRMGIIKTEIPKPATFPMNEARKMMHVITNISINILFI
jgi:hypothetical protein